VKLLCRDQEENCFEAEVGKIQKGRHRGMSKAGPALPERLWEMQNLGLIPNCLNQPLHLNRILG